MASPVALASACPLLPAVADSYDKHTSTAAGSTTPGCGHTRTNAKVQIAPYQALPVAGPVITHHRAAALDVVEPAADMPEEASVRGGVPPSARRASPSLMGNAPAATSSPPPPSHHVQERLACIHETLQKYMKKLAERTSHHMGCVPRVTGQKLRRRGVHLRPAVRGAPRNRTRPSHKKLHSQL
jgi:hypothetical protein